MDLTHFSNENKNFSIRSKCDKFKFELNLGLALPSKFRMNKNFDKTKKFVSIVQNVADDGSVGIIKCVTQSDKGPLKGLDTDVLAVLLTLASEQKDMARKVMSNGFRVYYTLAEICRRLKLPENNSFNVSESISNICSQKLILNNFVYKSDVKKAIKDVQETKIILKRGRITSSDANGCEFQDFSSYFYVEFDSNIISNLFNDYVSVLSSNKYLSLKSGPYRKLYIFLTSKRKSFGDRFVFPLSELTAVLGIEDSALRKQRELVGKYIKTVSEELNNFDFLIQKDRGKQSWTVYVEYKQDTELIATEEVDPYFSKLLQYYGNEKISLLGLVEIDIINIKEEFERNFKAEKQSITTTFQGEDINAAEFAIDVALFQVIKQNYHLTKSFKALAKAILKCLLTDTLEIPEGYRYFIDKRILHEQKESQKERLLVEKKKREEENRVKKEKIDLAFKSFFEEIVQKKKSQMDMYKELASAEIDEQLKEDNEEIDETFYNLRLSAKIRELARADFDECKMLDLAKEI